MMVNQAMANAVGQGKQPTGTPTAQAKTQEEASRRETKVSEDRVEPADIL